MEIKDLKLSNAYSVAFNTLVKNILSYIGYNLLAFVIGLVLAFVIFVIAIGIMSFAILMFMNGSFIVGGVIFGLGFSLILLAFWVLKSLFFIVNFYLTKFKIINDESSKPTIGMLLKSLIGKALVDFWYFIYFLIPLVLFLIGFGIIILNITSLSHGYDMGIIGNLLGGLFIGLSIGVGVFLYVKLYLAIYHCFDTQDFSFKNFKKIFDITKGQFWLILVNIIVLSILGLILFFIIKIIFTLIGLGFLFDFQQDIQGKIYIMFDKLSQGITSVNSNEVKLFFMYIVLYWLIRFILNILFSIYQIIFWFIYYKVLVSKEKEIK